MKRIPLEEQAAALLIAAPTDLNPLKIGRPGRAGVLSALTRLATFRVGARLLPYAVMGALIGVALLVVAATAPVLSATTLTSSTAVAWAMVCLKAAPR